MVVEKLLVSQLIDYINQNKDNISLPCYVMLGLPLKTEGEALWLSVLGKAQPQQKYIRAKFSGTFPFALYYRMTAKELDGMEAKMMIPSENLEIFLVDKQLDFDGIYISKIEQTKGAAIFSRSEDGSVTYQSLWSATFNER